MGRHADLYCQQLDRVAAKLQGKQDRIYFLHDNAKAHIKGGKADLGFSDFHGFLDFENPKSNSNIPL